MPRQFATTELDKIANEIAVDVIGVILVLGERAVCINFPDTDLPQLSRQDFKVVNQMQPSSLISGGKVCRVAWTEHRDRTAQLLERHFIVARWQESVGLKNRNRSHSLPLMPYEAI